jgi:hypothetical protein
MSLASRDGVSEKWIQSEGWAKQADDTETAAQHTAKRKVTQRFMFGLLVHIVRAKSARSPGLGASRSVSEGQSEGGSGG